MSRYESEIREALEEYASASGMGAYVDVIMQIGRVESGLDPNARPIDQRTGRVLSSAEGVWQFIDATWEENGGGDKYRIEDQARNIVRLTSRNIDSFRNSVDETLRELRSTLPILAV